MTMPVVEARLAPAYDYLQRSLTPGRLAHCLGVMQVMGELAEVYGLDRDQALATGLLHDSAKDLSNEQQLALAEQAGITFRYDCERHPVYLHAPLGAYLAATEFNQRDPDLLDAIATHSHYGEGNDRNPQLAWCLRCADLLAPSSPWLGMQKLRHYAFAGDLDTAGLLLCGWLREYFVDVGVPIHPNIDRHYAERTARLAPDAAFFVRW